MRVTKEMLAEYIFYSKDFVGFEYLKEFFYLISERMNYKKIFEENFYYSYNNFDKELSQENYYASKHNIAKGLNLFYKIFSFYSTYEGDIDVKLQLIVNSFFRFIYELKF